MNEFQVIQTDGDEDGYMAQITGALSDDIP